MKTRIFKFPLAAFLLAVLGLTALPHHALASGTSTADLMVLAERGSSLAQRTLGERFATGAKDAPKDMGQAIYWWEKAADNGDPLAQFNLGMVYLRGAGTPQDRVRAHMWFSLAAASSKETVSGQQGKMMAESEKKAVEADMTPNQIEESQALAKEWLAQRK